MEEKKKRERQYVEEFGIDSAWLRENERPDFVYEQTNGSIIGIELTEYHADSGTAGSKAVIADNIGHRLANLVREELKKLVPDRADELDLTVHPRADCDSRPNSLRGAARMIADAISSPVRALTRQDPGFRWSSVGRTRLPADLANYVDCVGAHWCPGSRQRTAHTKAAFHYGLSPHALIDIVKSKSREATTYEFRWPMWLLVIASGRGHSRIEQRRFLGQKLRIIREAFGQDPLRFDRVYLFDRFNREKVLILRHNVGASVALQDR